MIGIRLPRALLPARRTSVAPPDPIVLAAAGRAYFRLEDPIRRETRVKEWTSGASKPAATVKLRSRLRLPAASGGDVAAPHIPNRHVIVPNTLR
jgi:hypothetical protein